MQYRLGVMYATGRGVQRSDAEAVKWFRKAIRELQILAEQGNIGAQFSLGGMYYNGWGVQQDNAEAVKWYRRAAERGHEMSQYNIGAIYADGRGVPQDELEAVKWSCKCTGGRLSDNTQAAQEQGFRRSTTLRAEWRHRPGQRQASISQA